MIQTEKRTIKDTVFDYTYSDAGYYITRDGQKYAEAYDPENSGRVYTETDELIEEEATTEDYENALNDLGVVL